VKHDKWLLLSGFAVLSPARTCPHFCGMYQLYHDYFKWLCQLHPSIAHTDANKAFEFISVEEAFGDFRTAIGTNQYIFRLIDYTWGLTADGSYEQQSKQGGFIVAKKIDKRNSLAAGRIATRNQCETIVNDFVSHMVADSQNGHPLFGRSIDSIELLKLNVQPLLNTGDGSYDGLIATFSWQYPNEYRLDCHPVPEWQELSPSTYDGTPPTPPTYWQLGDGGFWST
jgi:hypothetical protein